MSTPSIHNSTLTVLAFAALVATTFTTGVWAANAPVRATDNVVVEAVQMPAWVEREAGRREALAPGMSLRANDRLSTGAGSRLLLRSRDGSAIKLGESANFRLVAAEQRPDNVFAASLQVLSGAFRFTTEALAKYRGKRDVSIQVATVTAGIRGTDLWGKSEPNREIVCLIEGNIEVVPQNENPVVMDQPLQFFQRVNGRSLPVASVPPAQLQAWAAETEIEVGRGAVRRGGQWKVTLATVDTQAEALRVYDRVQDAGYAAQIQPAQADGKSTYTVRIGNLTSRGEAEALAASLKGQMGVDDPRVFR